MPVLWSYLLPPFSEPFIPETSSLALCRLLGYWVGGRHPLLPLFGETWQDGGKEGSYGSSQCPGPQIINK